jgi:ABC-type transport system substrate-binding protein
MRAQAEASDPQKRKQSFDRVQQIVYEQAPFIYLVNLNALSAVSSSVAGANPGILYPQTFWNADRLMLTGSATAKR